MKVAIISDTHGDLVALRRVLEDLESDASEQLLMAGDIAQGGPQPAEVVDLLIELGCPLVRGNSDDFLVRLARGESVDPAIPEATIARGRWSIERLGSRRLDLLAGLPLQVRLEVGARGPLAVVHATPWSNEDVVLPDAPDEVANRMVAEAGAAILAYGHIHSAYQRLLGEGLLLSVGAVSASNDSDPRPAYTRLELDAEVWVDVRRVECSTAERLAAYGQAGLDLTSAERARVGAPGEWPVRSFPGRRRLWPPESVTAGRLPSQ